MENSLENQIKDILRDGLDFDDNAGIMGYEGTKKEILSLISQRESELREKIKVYIRKNVATQTASSLQVFMKDIDKIFTEEK